jgi:hypothetical protein
MSPASNQNTRETNMPGAAATRTIAETLGKSSKKTLKISKGIKTIYKCKWAYFFNSSLPWFK